MSGNVWWDRVMSLDPNWVIVFLTLALAWLAREEKNLNRKTLAHTEAVERAYVTISHTPATVEDKAGRIESEPGGLVWFEVTIKNYGNTPAEVLGGMMAVEIGPEGSSAPSVIPTGKYQPIPPCFLVPQGHVTFRSLVWGPTEDEIRRALHFKSELRESETPLELWLVGFVVYRDRFQAEHCGSYARHWYRHGRDLVFDATTEHLNYDRAPTPEQLALLEAKN